jgi:hypothetical protein
MRRSSKALFVVTASVLLCVGGAVLSVNTLAPKSEAGEPTPKRESMQVYQRHAAIPPEISALDTELTEFQEVYPPGVTPPTVADLLPWAVGAEVVSQQDGEIVYRSTQENPETREMIGSPGSSEGATRGNGAVIVTKEGDVAILAAVNWECAWIGEFVSASEDNDVSRKDEAIRQISRFPDLDVVRKYNPELGDVDREALVPRIKSGDVEFARYVLTTSCQQ